jgi:16S rRNA (cytidine1402-2'-O)-methyltransferase
MNTLYVVATPIGNLEDITIRATKILLSTFVIACEDTRRTGQLIKILESRYSTSILKSQVTNHKFISVRDWNEAKVLPLVVQELEKNDVALVSDAGTPLISDPGYKVVRAAREAGYQVVPIPGVSAVTAALSAAGLPTNKFMFWGFLPKKWELLPGMTHVIYESPKRTSKTLDTLKVRYPEAEIVVASEMTKIHERFIKDDGYVGDKGEVTLLVYLPSQEVAAGHI